MDFQHWVAYDLYGHCKQDTAGQLRCPFPRCSAAFESLELCLQHLTACAWLSYSCYWCPRCNRPERFADSDPTLISPHKVEPPCEVPDCAALPAQRSPIAKFTTARFWKHIRNKSNILFPHQIVPMSPSSKGEKVVTRSSHSLSGNATRSARNPRTRYDALSAAGASDKDSKTANLSELESPPYPLDKCNVPKFSGGGSFDQRQELGSPNDQDIDTVLEQRPALSSQPYELDNSMPFRLPSVDGTPELQGNQHYTERSSETTKATELPNNQLGRIEVAQSAPPYTSTHYDWTPYKPSSADNSPQPGLTWDSTQDLGFAGSSVAEPPLHYDSGFVRSGPPFQPWGTVPSWFTTQRYEGPNILPIENASTQRSASFDQFSSQQFPEMDSASTSLDTVYHQELEETFGCDSYPQSHPLADYSETPNQTIPRGYGQGLLPTNDPIIGYPSKEPHLTQEGADHLRSSGIPASYGAPNRMSYPVYPTLKGASTASNHQQEYSPFSSPAPSDSNLSPSDFFPGAGVLFTQNNPRSAPLVAVLRPGPQVGPSSTGVPPMASLIPSSFQTNAQYQTSTSRDTIKCSTCGKTFKGSLQDRKQNLRRHVRFSCQSPREEFRCSTDGCKSVFARPDNLKTHQKEHKGRPALQRSNARIRRRKN